MATPRRVVRVVRAVETSDGAGVRLKRSLGSRELDYHDPFLLLDEFKSDDPGDYIAGFPDHPHRGFETVTYMLAGSMEHKDHRGNKGNLVAGGVQWMTAGRGIVHSEMPRQVDGLMWGLQLWINLSAAEKMREPRYQEFSPEAIPEAGRAGGARVRVIAGGSSGLTGAVRGISTEPLYLDVALRPEARFEQEVVSGHNLLAYVVEGAGRFSEAEDKLEPGQLAVFSDGDLVSVATRQSPLRFLLLAARPLDEPMVRYGPFVMNTPEQIQQAFQDYRSGRLSFAVPVSGGGSS